MDYRKTICYSCLGCNRLEIKSFQGTYRCNNYIRGTNDFQNRRKDKEQRQTKN